MKHNDDEIYYALQRTGEITPVSGFKLNRYQRTIAEYCDMVLNQAQFDSLTGAVVELSKLNRAEFIKKDVDAYNERHKSS